MRGWLRVAKRCIERALETLDPDDDDLTLSRLPSIGGNVDQAIVNLAALLRRHGYAGWARRRVEDFFDA